MRVSGTIGVAVASGLLSLSAGTAATPLPSDAQRHQEQQLDAVRREALSSADVLTPGAGGHGALLVLPRETQCVEIRSIEWRGAADFPWLSKQAPGVGQCAGTRGLAAIRSWVTGQLAARGYITSLAAIPEQDYADGRVIVEVLPGRIGEIEDGSGGIGTTRGVFPRGRDALLNVRDLDQALENMRRLPGQSDATFAIAPGSSLGDSDIRVGHPADARRIRAVLTADNGGQDATGRNQVGAIVAVDSPLGLYDQLLLTAGNDAYPRRTTRGSRSASASWDVPVGYASFSVSASEWATRQAIPVGVDTFVYARRTRRIEAGVGYVPYRSGSARTRVGLTLARREDRAWFDGIELRVQKHDITSYAFSASHLQRFAQASVEAGASWRGSLPGLSGFPGYVQDRNDWNGHYGIATASVSVDAQFAVGARRANYRGTFVAQRAPAPVPSTEFLQIGGRYTVRGFDGNETLAARSGWILRNEFSTRAAAGIAVYAALDAGGVSGNPDEAGGHTLVGGALGLRGGYKRVSFDVALGMPLLKPSTLHSASPTLDVQIAARF
ncbi:TPA: ShlB/FhaC/HecB family hemolysin secretion/activation protein [Burkholderia aenigmatica]|uniref:ShlB/FhaC/HecB family hemolysin secretion/activation protein n=1 Tax=Burkholderia sp. AU45251 TaxID=3059204 RepID=UPI0026519612|nr:ShlB/FhaC/HecB family hemolysin secretion/activation protein [Burkholderia sp. AU45251]HDR9486674.1 ShlB/FhaC/HecB family hemolysin secretion/activation protein [Burkholderia aenigmatica]MDN7518537.1 ShlB/FhaC/HecB family hemolysin secretion/activation protein [Burkholderia sp. AU45251]HDR9518227.1 ShlB/FhaC/HecB family hemolysin secretion/activation protein [Burkholderia aenigmatica]HDR9595094.1 ShlB/FhaC/HecB family hemolysin secretion/activation protein [Burkholderia aenigmatica]HDR96048